MAEQLCVLFCVFVKSRINVAVAISYIICICIAVSSGTVRSFKGLHPFLQDYNKIVHTKYAAALLHSAVFLSREMKCEESATISCPVPADYLVSRIGDSDVEVKTTQLVRDCRPLLIITCFRRIISLSLP